MDDNIDTKCRIFARTSFLDVAIKLECGCKYLYRDECIRKYNTSMKRKTRPLYEQE